MDASPTAVARQQLSEARGLLRTCLAATIRPARFLAEWQADEGRFLSPLRLLAVNGALVALVSYSVHLLGLGPGNPLEELGRRTRAAGVALDALTALLPLVMVWSQVIGTRAAATLVGGRSGWPQALRQAGFLSAVYVPATVLSLAALAAWPQRQGLIGLASIAVDLGYGTIAFRRLHALPPARSVAGACLAVLLTLALASLAQLAGSLLVGVLSAVR